MIEPRVRTGEGIEYDSPRLFCILRQSRFWLIGDMTLLIWTRTALTRTESAISSKSELGSLKHINEGMNGGRIVFGFCRTGGGANSGFLCEAPGGRCPLFVVESWPSFLGPGARTSTINFIAAAKKILEIVCGTRYWLSEFIKWGVTRRI